MQSTLCDGQRGITATAWPSLPPAFGITGRWGPAACPSGTAWPCCVVLLTDKTQCRPREELNPPVSGEYEQVTRHFISTEVSLLWQEAAAGTAGPQPTPLQCLCATGTGHRFVLQCKPQQYSTQRPTCQAGFLQDLGPFVLTPGADAAGRTRPLPPQCPAGITSSPSTDLGSATPRGPRWAGPGSCQDGGAQLFRSDTRRRS